MSSPTKQVIPVMLLGDKTIRHKILKAGDIYRVDNCTFLLNDEHELMCFNYIDHTINGPNPKNHFNYKEIILIGFENNQKASRLISQVKQYKQEGAEVYLIVDLNIGYDNINEALSLAAANHISFLPLQDLEKATIKTKLTQMALPGTPELAEVEPHGPHWEAGSGSGASAEQPPFIVNLFFNGTGHAIHEPTAFDHLANLLYTLSNASDGNDQMSLVFDGCAVNKGPAGNILGVITGRSIDPTCEEIINNLVALQENQASGRPIIINAYGHSRGAITVLTLAREIQKTNLENITINLALFDAVPGNSLTFAASASSKMSLANKNRDLSHCTSIGNVLALYTNEPLPDMAFHAPLLPDFPVNSEVTVDITPGCHSNAQIHYQSGRAIVHSNNSFPVFARFVNFFIENGTHMTVNLPHYYQQGSENAKQVQFTEQGKVSDQSMLNYYDWKISTGVEACNRAGHHGLRIITQAGANYVNTHHCQLAGVPYHSAPVAMIYRAPTPAPDAVSFSAADPSFFDQPAASGSGAAAAADEDLAIATEEGFTCIPRAE